MATYTRGSRGDYGTGGPAVSTGIKGMYEAITGSETLMNDGSVTEYLPAYEELTYQFREGLTAQIAHHGEGKFLTIFDGVATLEVSVAADLVSYLENLE